MSEEIIADSSKLQQGLVTVLVGVKAIASDSDFHFHVRVGPAVNLLSSRYMDVSFPQVDAQTCRDGLRVDRYDGVNAPALEEKIARHVEKNARDPSVPKGHVDQAHLVERTGCQEIIDDDSSKLKEGLVTLLKRLAAIYAAAAMVKPIFWGLSGSLIRLVLNHVDNEDIRTLKREFGTVNRAFDKLSQQNSSALLQINKETVDGQYFYVEQNLKNQFRKYMEMLEAQPKHRERKKIDFKESYYGNNNLHSLYDGVVGTRKLFGQPILEVYLKHSGGHRPTMERLMDRLKILFCIGLIALMGYAAIIEDDEEELMEDWSKKMEAVQKKMEEALQRCNATYWSATC